jgi:hypothetical protein
MLKRFRSLTTLLALLWGFADANEITNGEFDTDLSGWTASGDVMHDAGTAVVGDDGAVYSSLYQAVAGAGRYRLEFDFLNGLSSDGGNPSFPQFDSLYASVYLIDDLAGFDLAGSYDDFIALFALDYLGAFDLADGAMVGPSIAKGGSWQHFSLSFQSSYGHLIPAFELNDLNFVPDDSTVGIDNVTLTQLVPSPAPAALVILGLLALRSRRWGPWRPGYHL